MYTLKGFYSIPAFINNEANQVATFGEISDDSLTYGKDKSILTGSSAPNVGLISFHSVRDETVVPVEANYLEQSLKLGQYLYAQAIAGTITSNPNTLKQLVMAEFAGVISSFNCGVMRNDGRVWMPEYVVFKLVGAEANELTIWLSDRAFQAQYDGYLIEVIQPLYPVDDFFKDPLVVKDLLSKYNIVEKLEAAQSRRADYPYTYLKAFDFDYVNPADTTQRYKATWLVLIYGEAGNNSDLIKDAIVKDILNQSSKPKEEWEIIIPDLFLTTEFIFVPMWGKYSVPNSQFQSGLYSPSFDPSTDLKIVRRMIRGTGYTDTWTNANYQTSANQYKSVGFAAVGNPKNRGGITKFTKQFPQYLIAEPGTGDSNRVDPDTLEWMSLFSELLKAAETMTAYTSVPQGISRMKRDNVIYAAAYFKNVNYMVATKDSVTTLV